MSRDTLSFCGGWYLMIYQGQFAADFRWPAFVGGMVAAGIPGVLQALPLLIPLWAGSTPGPSPDSPPEVLPVESPS
jgi:hypothetical protein